MIFDIETAPLAGVVDQFDASAVNLDNLKDPSAMTLEYRLGNLKDTAKIEAKKAEQLARFNAEKETAERKRVEKVEAARAKFVTDAALHPETARILCIGLYCPVEVGLKPRILQGSEDSMLLEFWGWFKKSRGTWAGFNITNFDLQMLCCRSWLHDIATPVLDRRSFVDLLDVWKCGSRDPSRGISADRMFRYFGFRPKPFDGAMFSKFYEEDHQAAMTYLTLELTQLDSCARRMQLNLTPGLTVPEEQPADPF